MQKSTMEAIVCYAPKDYRYEQNVPRPVAGPNEMVIKIKACGICTSDCKCWQGAKACWGGIPNPITGEIKESWIKPPVTPGHEFFGHIVEMGEGAKEHFVSNEDERFQIGDRVIADQIIPCTKYAMSLYYKFQIISF
ncbi:alcohol dehydrogenase groES-like domain-containing protein [Ditylenchus destructor]|nr:alcohol dehydrogenase groES-like domain-containing protein [Ditylenchus destructor]